jgi:acyl-CoA thioesterase-1
MNAAAPPKVPLVRFAPLLGIAFLLSACSTQPPSPQTNAAATSAAAAAPETPAVVSAASDERKRIVIVGDSISAGYGVNRGQSFPDDLQKRLDDAKLPWKVVNQGISGDTTSGGVNRITTAIEAMPSIVVLELGGNDGLRGMPLDSTRENLEKLIKMFQAANAQVVLAGMTLPPNYGPDYIRKFEAIYKDLAAKYKVKLIPFLLADMITPDLRYFQPDGIHPTAEGAEIVAGTVLKALQPLLK